MLRFNQGDFIRVLVKDYDTIEKMGGEAGMVWYGELDGSFGFFPCYQVSEDI